MSIIKNIPLNYVTYLYLLNSAFSIYIAAFDYYGAMQNTLSILLIFIFGFAGYLNARKGKDLKSICWPFFLNVVVSAINILGIEVFGAYNNFITSSSDFFASLQLIQLIGNSYLIVFIHRIDHMDDTLLFFYFIPIPFIIPYLGFVIGRFLHTKGIT